MNSIENAVLDILVDICGTKKVKKDYTINLIKEGYLDSMGIVSLITEIEDEFGIDIPLTTFNLEDFSTSDKIIAFVKENKYE